MKTLPIKSLRTALELNAFIEKNNYKYFAGIHGVDVYVNEEVYVSDGKIYNLLIGRRYFDGGSFLLKQVNGLKIRQNLGGYYVNTALGVVYINGLVDNKK